MNRTQVLWLLNYLSAAYRSFTIDSEEAEGVVNVWIDILQDIPFESAQEATRRLCRIKTDFAPTPAEIYQACLDNELDLSVYQIQQREHEQRMLELKEYHETEEVGPMPDSVRERLDKVFKKARVIDN